MCRRLEYTRGSIKHVLREAGRDEALRAVAFMKKGRVVELDESLALNAARISHSHKIPMADSIMLATARAHEATLWTQDVDVEGLDDVQYIPEGQEG